jgi:tripartite-type tricarboxylate transporter receptor subunit TctC
MRTVIRLTGLLAFAVFGWSGTPLVAHAQSYPTKSITVVVPFPAGGPSDVVARIVTERMGRTLGHQMVIENVSGAGGTLGSARVAAARPLPRLYLRRTSSTTPSATSNRSASRHMRPR